MQGFFARRPRRRKTATYAGKNSYLLRKKGLLFCDKYITIGGTKKSKECSHEKNPAGDSGAVAYRGNGNRLFRL
jgi:hypothetical protein